ncbi:MAG: DNA primase [Gemmatimonadota bacterium]
MVRIPEELLQEIRERVDLVELVGEGVQLRKRGRNFVGLCPFHRERTPSFNVNPELQIFKCFGCGAGGNALTYLMARENLDFPEAARRLAARAGLELPEAGGEARPRWEPLHGANAFAAEFYERALRESSAASPARAYLDARGVDEDARAVFRLGWAPDAWDGLLSAARDAGIAQENLLEAGLLSRSERTGGLFDRFRARVVFPILEPGGRVAGFSGRLLADGRDAPKYLNTGETPVFHKGALLFGLALTKNAIRRAGEVVVVEGNFDLVSLHARGIPNVVAPLGTALTPEQALLLRRYAPRAVLLYDSDEAGLKAAFRSADELVARGLQVRIAFLPPGTDLDAFVRAEGTPALQALLREAPDVIAAKLRVLRERLDLSRVDARRRAIELLLRSIRRIPDAITRDLQAGFVADELGVDPALVARQASPRGPTGGLSRRGGAPEPGTAEPRPAGSAIARARRQAPAASPALIFDEKYLLLVLVHRPEYLAEAREQVRPEDLTVPGYRRVYEALLEPGDVGAAADPRRLLDRLDPEGQGVLSELLLSEESLEEAGRIFRDALEKVRQDSLTREVAEMRRDGGDSQSVWERKREQLGLPGGRGGGP